MIKFPASNYSCKARNRESGPVAIKFDKAVNCLYSSFWICCLKTSFWVKSLSLDNTVVNIQVVWTGAIKLKFDERKIQVVLTGFSLVGEGGLGDPHELYELYVPPQNLKMIPPQSLLIMTTII